MTPVTVYAYDGYKWSNAVPRLADVELLERNVYPAKTAVGAHGAKFTFRAKAAPQAGNMLVWRGRAFIVTTVLNQERHGYTAVFGGEVEIKTVNVFEGVQREAVLLEKYIKTAQEAPQRVADECYILIVPKCAEALNTADLVAIEGVGTFYVDVVHMANPDFIEYEIVRREER